ncbi:MAG: dTDP-4-dehydrorhamnose 3,5-epimerase family protein [Planctomycetaceae bacterium]
MQFREMRVAGARLVETTAIGDDRGTFCRIWCAEEFLHAGLPATLSQASLSGNVRRGTLRGMHYRPADEGEYKLVRCIRGSVFDVVLDLRPDSPTWLRWDAVILSATDRNALCIPPGCAHGFLTLEDDTDLLYMMSVPYRPGAERGVRWNDPAFGILWPSTPDVIAARDASYPDHISPVSPP